MKKHLEKIKEMIVSHKLIFIVITIFVIVIIFYLLGFRITYNPDIISDWTAVSAVGQWCSIAASIFVVYLSSYLSQKFEQKTKDIANSNRAKVELMSEIEKSIDEKIKRIESFNVSDKTELNTQEDTDIQKKVISYIEVSIVTSTEKIANYIGKSVDDTYQFLQKMEIEDKIVKHIGDTSYLAKEELLWKIDGNQ